MKLQIKTLKQTEKKKTFESLDKIAIPWAERGGGFSPNTTELAESQARLRHAKPLTELYEVHTQATPNLFT